MRVLAGLAFAIGLAAASPAWAHGGGGDFGGARESPGSVDSPGERNFGAPDISDRSRPQLLPEASSAAPASVSAGGGVPTGDGFCTCAHIACPHCTAEAVRRGRGLERRTQVPTEIRKFGDDIAHVRVVLEFRARRGLVTEAVATVDKWSAFAVTSARLERGDTTFRAAAGDIDRLGRDYLRTTRRREDPLLLTRTAPGRYEVRVFPVDHRVVRVVLEGYAVVGIAVRARRLYADSTMTLLAHHERAKPGDPARWIDRTSSRTYAFEARVKGADLPDDCVMLPDGVLSALDEATKSEPKRWIALEQPPEPERPPEQGDPRDV